MYAIPPPSNIMSVAQRKIAPHEILLLASHAGRCMSATANISKPPSPTAGQVSVPETWTCFPQAPHSPLPADLITLLGMSSAQQVAGLSF